MAQSGRSKRPEGGGSAVVQGARLDWVDTGRGIAICLVALFHSTNWLYITGIDLGVWSDINTVLSSLRMPMFFVLAGLFAAKWLTATWGDLLRTKVLLFGWVLIVWSVIGMAVQLTGLHVAGQPVSIGSALRDLVLSPIKPLFELWFIWALALFFVIAKATRRVPAVAQLVVAGALSAFGLTVWLNTTTGLTGSAKFYFFFIAGLYLRSMVLAFAASGPWIRVTVLLVWAVVSVGLFAFDLRGVPGAYFVNCLLGVLAGVTLSRLATRIRLLARLGQQTLPIYVAHTPFAILIAILITVIPPLLAAAAVVSAILPILVATSAVAAAIGLNRVVRATPLQHLYAPPRPLVRALGGRA